MKVRVDFQKNITLPGGSSPRYGDGEFDPTTGILWLDERQGATAVNPGRTIKAGMGIHLASRMSMLRLEPAPEAKPAKKTEAKPAA